jgi:hypothetical protein
MFDDTKYIIVDQQGTELPVIFPHLINHSDMRHAGKVVSAGFCQIFASDADKKVSVAVGGKSDSLKINSRPEDKEIIERWLNRWQRDY